jgi:hypothetical protein
MTMHGFARWRLLLLLAGLVTVLTVGAVACGDDDDDGNGDEATPTEDAEPTEVEGTPVEGVSGRLDITALEYSFEGVPASQPGGLTTITLDNIGAEDHQAQIVRLNEGVTLEQFQTALQADESGLEAVALVSLAGGVNAIAGGSNQVVVNDLSEGTHVMLCFVSDANDVPHFASGMITQFEVTAPEGEEPQPPAPDTSLNLAEFQFDGMDTLAAGRAQTVQVINNGQQPHEVGIWKLEEGFTVEQLAAFFSEEEPTPDPSATPEEEGPPPFSSAGGLGAIAASEDGYMVLNLEAGNYALICFIPDPGSGGAPHAALGMLRALTVE